MAKQTGKQTQTRKQKAFRKIKELFAKKHRIYGYKRIAKILPEDMKASEGRVHRLMKANGLKSKTAKKYRPQTTDSNHNMPVAENILNRAFNAEAPCQKWVSDITYIPTEEGFYTLPEFWTYMTAGSSGGQCRHI